MDSSGSMKPMCANKCGNYATVGLVCGSCYEKANGYQNPDGRVAELERRVKQLSQEIADNAIMFENGMMEVWESLDNLSQRVSKLVPEIAVTPDTHPDDFEDWFGTDADLDELEDLEQTQFDASSAGQ